MTDGTNAIKAAISATAPADTPMVNIFEPEPIRKQSGALVIAGKLNAVGENFAGITTGNQSITLGINTDQARWLGRYVGGQIKLTVEVQCDATSSNAASDCLPVTRAELEDLRGQIADLRECMMDQQRAADTQANAILEDEKRND